MVGDGQREDGAAEGLQFPALPEGGGRGPGGGAEVAEFAGEAGGAEAGIGLGANAAIAAQQGAETWGAEWGWGGIGTHRTP